jgi:hypothetical protein
LRRKRRRRNKRRTSYLSRMQVDTSAGILQQLPSIPRTLVRESN